MFKACITIAWILGAITCFGRQTRPLSPCPLTSLHANTQWSVWCPRDLKLSQKQLAGTGDGQGYTWRQGHQDKPELMRSVCSWSSPACANENRGNTENLLILHVIMSVWSPHVAAEVRQLHPDSQDGENRRRQKEEECMFKGGEWFQEGNLQSAWIQATEQYVCTYLCMSLFLLFFSLSTPTQCTTSTPTPLQSQGYAEVITTLANPHQSSALSTPLLIAHFTLFLLPDPKRGQCLCKRVRGNGCLMRGFHDNSGTSSPCGLICIIKFDGAVELQLEIERPCPRRGGWMVGRMRAGSRMMPLICDRPSVFSSSFFIQTYFSP